MLAFSIRRDFAYCPERHAFGKVRPGEDSDAIKLGMGAPREAWGVGLREG